MLILFFPGRLAGLFPSSQNDGADNIDEDEHHDPQLADDFITGLLNGKLAHGEIFIPTHSTKLNTPFCIVIFLGVLVTVQKTCVFSRLPQTGLNKCFFNKFFYSIDVYKFLILGKSIRVLL